MNRRERPEDAAPDDFCVVVSGTGSPFAAAALKAAAIAAPDEPESLVLLSTRAAGRLALLACAGDSRGLVYALLELADRVRHPVAGRGPFWVGHPIGALTPPNRRR